jgi:hypothetical protein
MGIGSCDTFSRSGTLDDPTYESSQIAELGWSLYKSIDCPPRELRGIGIHMSDLESEKGVKVDKKRKRDETTASQPTLAKMLVAKLHKETVVIDDTKSNSKEERLKSLPPQRPPKSRSRRGRGQSSESEEDDAMDMEDDMAETYQDRPTKSDHHIQRTEEIISIDDDITAEIAAPKNYVLPSNQLFFRLPEVGENEFISNLVEALRSLDSKAANEPTYVELCQQLVVQWLQDCNLPAVQTFLCKLESEIPLSSLERKVREVADAVILSKYSATL